MKIYRQLSIASSVFLIVLSSCSLQKRQYMPGLNIEWNNSKNQLSQKEGDSQALPITESTQAEQAAILDRDDEGLMASSSNERGNIVPKKEKNNLMLGFNEQPLIATEDSNTSFQAGFKRGLTLFEPSADAPKNHGLAVTSMILGILSLVTLYGAFLFGLLAIIFGAVALRKIKANPEKYKGKGMAKAGLICGIVALGLIIVIVATL